MFGWVSKLSHEKLLKKVALLEYELNDSNLNTKVCRKLWYEAADALRLVKKENSDLMRHILHLKAAARFNVPPQSSGGQFTQDELRSLLQLVHPDKHGGKASAVTLTQKINRLRN